MTSTQNSFPRTRRITARRDFDRAFQERCKAADALLVIYAAKNGLQWPRLGLVISRRLGPAHVRNRLKRLVREAFRLRQHQLPQGVDWVCVLKSVPKPTLPNYESSLMRLTARIASKLPT